LFKVEKNDPSGFCQILVIKCSSRIDFTSLNDDCSAQNKPRELKLVSLELSRNEDSEYVFKYFYPVCERNGKAKHLATPFSRDLWGEGGAVGQIGPQR
jgi:hypothetical protein